jgi:hypothetical protein
MGVPPAPRCRLTLTVIFFVAVADVLLAVVGPCEPVALVDFEYLIKNFSPLCAVGLDCALEYCTTAVETTNNTAIVNAALATIFLSVIFIKNIIPHETTYYIIKVDDYSENWYRIKN